MSSQDLAIRFTFFLNKSQGFGGGGKSVENLIIIFLIIKLFCGNITLDLIP